MVRTYYQQLDSFDAAMCNQTMDEMEELARQRVLLGASKGAKLTTRRVAYMRYHGQGHEISVVLPEGLLGADAAATIQSLFDAAYKQVFGRNIGNIAVGEIVTLSVTASTEAHPDLTPDIQPDQPPSEPYQRPVFDSASQTEMSFSIVARESLAGLAELAGPAIITEDETSVVVSSVFNARTLPGGDIELRRKLVS